MLFFFLLSQVAMQPNRMNAKTKKKTEYVVVSTKWEQLPMGVLMVVEINFPAQSDVCSLGFKISNCYFSLMLYLYSVILNFSFLPTEWEIARYLRLLNVYLAIQRWAQKTKTIFQQQIKQGAMLLNCEINYIIEASFVSSWFRCSQW